MYDEDANELKGYIPHGTKVTINQGPYGTVWHWLKNTKVWSKRRRCGWDLWRWHENCCNQIPKRS